MLCRMGPFARNFLRGCFVLGGIDAQQHEDCLTLTIWAPLPLNRGRPVLVWFHGGGYTSGAGSLPWYCGERLAREGDIVVVGVNSRVGALGISITQGSHPETWDSSIKLPQ